MLNAFRHQRMKHIGPKLRGFHAVSVLNAFRHQRMKHSRMDRTETQSARAQRLSASTNETLRDVVEPVPDVRGAQRLSASTNETP